MPIDDIAWVLEQTNAFCDQHGLVFGAYPMHEVAAHPQAAEILRLVADQVGAAEFEPLATTGVPLATRQDWSELLGATVAQPARGHLELGRSGPSRTRSSDQSSSRSSDLSARNSTATPFFSASRPTNSSRPPRLTPGRHRTAVTSAPMGRSSVVLGLAPSWRRRSRISWFGTVTVVARRSASRLRPVATHPAKA